MVDSVQTFRAVCVGGLNTSNNVLSQGADQPGSATDLLNYEPALEGGYRRLSGFSHSYGTVTGTGSVLGVAVVNGIQQGLLAMRKPSSGNNYLHYWNYYYQFNVASDANLTVGETITERTSAGDSSTATLLTGTLVSKNSNTIIVNFGKLPSAVFTNGNAISDDDFSTSTTLTSVPAVIGWVEITCDVIANDRDGVSASASISAGNNAVIGGALADGGAVNFVTAASEQPRQVTIFGSGNETGRTFTITGTDNLDLAKVEAIAGPNNTTVSTSGYFKTVTSVSVSIPTQVIVKAGGDESSRKFTVTGTDSEDATLEEVIDGPNASTTTGTELFKTITQISVDDATAGAIEVGTSSDDNGICESQTPGSASNLTINGALASTGTVSFAAATAGAIEVGSGTGQFRQSNPVMTGVTKVRTSILDFGVKKLVLTDGINPAALYDEIDGYVQITDANAPTDPKFSEIYAEHLFLAGDPLKPQELFFSSQTSETEFRPALGAGVFNVGFDIVALKVFRNILYIFGTNGIKRLVGSDSTNFELENVTNNLGCLATDSVVEIGGDLIFLAPDGIRPIGGTNKIGDVNLETVSKKIHTTVQNLITTEDLSTLSSVLIRSKSQFRYLFSSSGSDGLLGALRESGSGYGFEFSSINGINATCSDSGYIGTEEIVVHGDSSGKVYAQESGTSFDNTNIVSVYQTPFVYFQDPRQRKFFYELAAYLRSEGENSLTVAVVYDFGDVNTLDPDNIGLSNETPAAEFDEGKFQASDGTTFSLFDGNPSPVESLSFSGSGKSIALRFVTDGQEASHSIQGYTITYGLGDIR